MHSLVQSEKAAAILMPVSRRRDLLLAVLLGRRDLVVFSIASVSILLLCLTLLRGRLVPVIRPVKRVVVVFHFGALPR